MSNISSAGPGAPTPVGKPSPFKGPMKAGGFLILWMVVLFGGAGRMDWTRGWIFLGLYVAAMVVAGLAIHHFNPELMKAREQWRSKKDTKPFDRIFLAIYMPLTFIQPAIAGLDVRFGRTPMPAATIYWGATLFVLGAVLIAWTLAVNRFAETTVRIQTDRGHQVVSSGPYAVVRHPMYVGMVVMYGAGTLILGSLWALVPTALMTVLLIVRTALEDRTLRRELAGYEDYTRQTPYRLLPGVW